MAAGGGGIAARGALDPRRALKPLKVNRVSLKVGASKPFDVMHVSDTHFTFSDNRDAPRTQKLALWRTRAMHTGEHYLDEAMRAADAQNALLVHTGDLIDFTSMANYDAVAEHFAGRPNALVCTGNHDVMACFVIPETQKGDGDTDNAGRRAATQRNFPNDISFASKVVNGVNFVAMDDASYRITEEQAALFEKEAEKGLPIVLVCHIPPYSPRLFDVAMRVWRKGAYLCGVPDEKMGRYAPGELKQQRTDALTRDFLARLRSEPLLRAVLCGHIHKTSFDRFSPTACTCVAGPNYMGEAQLVSFA
jgi:3',5'-cyclic AMP phosphodiesterase CpdA